MSSAEDSVAASPANIDEEDGEGFVEGFVEEQGTQMQKEDTQVQVQKRKVTKPRPVVWDHFTKYVENGKGRCRCNYCGTSYKCNPRVNGTSTFNTHMKKCARNPSNKLKLPDSNQTQLTIQSSTNEKGEKEAKVKSWAFNYEMCRKGTSSIYDHS